MKLIIHPKTKKQEKAVKSYLEKMDIAFTKAEEATVSYKRAPKKPLTPKEKKILDNLDQSVDFVKKYRQGKVKAKSLQQLLNEL